MHASVVYKIVPRELWRRAEAAGNFGGSPVDVRDGYIHLSTATQARDTADRHFRGETDLLLVAVATHGLDVRWEVSRGGALFPHLYGDLPMSAVIRATPLPLGPGGQHIFPDLES